MSIFRKSNKTPEFHIKPARGSYKIKVAGKANIFKPVRNISICALIVALLVYAFAFKGINLADAGSAYIYMDGMTNVTLNTGSENTGYFKNGQGEEVFCVQHSILYSEKNYEEHSIWSYFSDAQIKQLAIWTWYVENNASGDIYMIKQIGIWALLNNSANASVTGGNVGGVNVYSILDSFRNWYDPNTVDFKYGGTYFYHSSSQNMSKFWAIYDPRGNIRVEKTSANPTITNANSLYSLLGAQYVIQQNGSVVTSIITGADGVAEAKDLPAGTYQVSEVMASKGYAINREIATLNVVGGKTTTLSNASCATETPMSNLVSMLISKYDSELGYKEGNNVAQGDATLAGAQFKFVHFAGNYSSFAEAKNSGKELRSWIFATDATGTITADNEHKISGDDLYRNASGAVCFPLGTYTIEEIAPPEGYLINNTKFIFRINETGTIENLTQYEKKNIPDDVIRGGVMMPKLDSETQLNAPLGGAELAGAEFEIRNISSKTILRTDGTRVEPGETVATIITDETGLAKTTENALAYGTYQIRETKAPKGYKISTETWTFSVREQGKMYSPNIEGAIDNSVIRGDISFSKKAEDDSTPLKGVPFVITNETTDEAHVVVTDENGFINTNSRWNPHSANVNANDRALKIDNGGAFSRNENGEYVAESELLDISAGVWFGQNRVGQEMNRFDGKTWVLSLAKGECAKVNDALPVLPYGKYKLEEARCESNIGLKLVSFNVYITRDGVNLDLGTVDDKSFASPNISTTATYSETTEKVLPYDEKITIKDLVTYRNLNEESSYTIIGHLTNKTTGEKIEGSESRKEIITPVTTNKTQNNITGFKGQNPIYGVDGKIEMLFELDTSGLSEHEIVVMEEVYDEDMNLIATDNNMSNVNQTVRVDKKIEELPVEEEPEEIVENVPEVQEKGEELARTGDAINIAYTTFLIGLACLALITVATSRKLKKKQGAFM